MSDENQNSVGQTQLTPVVSTPTSNQEGISLQIFLRQATKFTVLVLFAFYSVGFLIWHSYLASYGLSSISFLQTEYISAAFCYFILFGSFAIPTGLFIEHLINRKNEKENTHSISYDELYF